MICICGDRECDFEENSKATNFIFTPRPGIAQREIIHVLLSGVRCINIDLSLASKEDMQKLIGEVDWAIKIFLNETKFNLRISKVCIIRGRQLKTGRMKNNKEFSMKKCSKIVLTSDKRYEKCSSGEVCFISNLETAAEQLKPGDSISIGPSIKVSVMKTALRNFLTCIIVEEGSLQSYQRVELSVVEESHKPTKEESEDCEFAIKNEFDLVIVPSVKRPEYYHTIKRLLGRNRIKIFAQIDTCEEPTIDKIIEHFYGIYINESMLASSNETHYVISKARNLKKLIIAEFSTEKMLMSSFDSFLLEPSERAEIVTKSAEALIEASSESHEVEGTLEEIQVASSISSNRLKHAVNSEVKLIVSITSMRSALEEIANDRPACPIILLTKCPRIVKLSQLWRNVHAMVYVDCDDKPWADQRKEMTQIAALYGSELKMLEAKDFCVTWFDSMTVIDNRQ